VKKAGVKRHRAIARRWWTATAVSLALTVLAAPAAMAASSSAGTAAGSTAVGAAVAAASLGAGVQPTTVGGASPSGATCQNFYLTVTESPTATQTYKVWAQLCSRGPLTGKTVQVLVPGGDYTHVYWDWPNDPSLYSYVNTATWAGYTTLNLDKLGYGLSGHPDPATLDFPTGAYVVHQVVQYLRNGSLGVAFSKVVTNGHSFGGLTIEYEASAYHDVNGLIVSGFGHDLDVSDPDNSFVANTIPASADPMFAAEPWAPGYFTTKPGSRCTVFSYPGDVDPANCTVEEQTKGTLPEGELSTVVQDSYDPDMTKQITVPVLWALGVNDNLWCAQTHNCYTSSTPGLERSFWQPGLLTEYIAPSAGHSINVDYGAPAFYARTLLWLQQHNL
jgi:pimeloyl-ACP methyl ester carboxylesterase